MPARPVERNKNSRMERNTMLHRISIFVQLNARGLFDLQYPFCSRFPWLFVCTNVCPGAGTADLCFAEDASRALFDAMHLQDEQAPLSILGPAERSPLDRRPNRRFGCSRGFIVKYEEMHRFVIEPDGTVTLVVGPKTGRSDSLGEPPRHVVFRHRRGERRDVFRASAKMNLGHGCVPRIGPSAKQYLRAAS